jgi:hypothetical protein
MRFTALVLGLIFSFQALAAPILLEERNGLVTPLDAAAISSYSFYANFVAAAYCSGTVDWSCSKSSLSVVAYTLRSDYG